jgi:hypothetical protein
MATPGVNPVAGTKFFIGPAGSVPVSPDLFVEVGDISNLGDIAQQFAQVGIESIGSGDSYNLKGTRSYPNLDLQMNRNDSDAGQLALKAAANATRGTLYPFKVLEVDGGYVTWQGEVFGYGPSYGSVNTVRGVKTSVSIRPSTVTIVVGA